MIEDFHDAIKKNVTRYLSDPYRSDVNLWIVAYTASNPGTIKHTNALWDNGNANILKIDLLQR